MTPLFIAIDRCLTLSSGSLLTFEPSSSPELDSLISTLEKTIFIPNEFPRKQRDMIYKTTRHKELKENPLIIEKWEEDIEVEPVLPHDRPRVRRVLLDALKLMKVPEDFQNVPKILEGLTRAGRRYGPSLNTKIVRTFNEKELQKLTISCARAYKQTGFMLGDPEIAEEAMLGAHLVAQQGKWTKDSVELAFKNAVEIAQMLDATETVSQVQIHRGHSRVFHSGYIENGSPSARPHIIGVLLELSAIQAVKFNHGINDTDNQVQNYAAKFDTSWTNNKYQWERSEISAGQAAHHHSQTLTRWLPAWKGIQVALKVKNLDAGLKQKLKEHLAILDQKMKTARESLVAASGENKRRGQLLDYELSELKI
jgi:hypothetical protein